MIFAGDPVSIKMLINLSNSAILILIYLVSSSELKIGRIEIPSSNSTSFLELKRLGKSLIESRLGFPHHVLAGAGADKNCLGTASLICSQIHAVTDRIGNGCDCRKLVADDESLKYLEIVADGNCCDLGFCNARAC